MLQREQRLELGHRVGLVQRLVVADAQDAGDHTIFIAEVEEVVVREGNPLLYYRARYRTIEGSELRDVPGRTEVNPAGGKR